MKNQLALILLVLVATSFISTFKFLSTVEKKPRKLASPAIQAKIDGLKKNIEIIKDMIKAETAKVEMYAVQFNDAKKAKEVADDDLKHQKNIQSGLETYTDDKGGFNLYRKGSNPDLSCNGLYSKKGMFANKPYYVNDAAKKVAIQASPTVWTIIDSSNLQASIDAEKVVGKRYWSSTLEDPKNPGSNNFADIQKQCSKTKFYDCPTKDMPYAKVIRHYNTVNPTTPNSYGLETAKTTEFDIVRVAGAGPPNGNATRVMLTLKKNKEDTYNLVGLYIPIAGTINNYSVYMNYGQNRFMAYNKMTWVIVDGEKLDEFMKGQYWLFRGYAYATGTNGIDYTALYTQWSIYEQYTGFNYSVEWFEDQVSSADTKVDNITLVMNESRNFIKEYDQQQKNLEDQIAALE